MGDSHAEQPPPGVLGALQRISATITEGISTELSQPPMQREPLHPGVALPSIVSGKVLQAEGGGAGAPELERASVLFPEQIDDGVRRTGNTFTACAHTITAVIGAGVLSLPNAMAALGWIGGPICFVAFAAITLYTAQLLADLYIIDGKRQRTYTDMVSTCFGKKGEIAIGIVQHFNLVLTALAYTITAATTIQWLAENAGSAPASFNHFWFWAVMFGLLQIVLCQVPSLEYFWWASMAGAGASFGYATIALVMNCVYIGRNPDAVNPDTGEPANLGHGDIAGLTDFSSTAAHVWNVLNCIGAILFAYSFSFILLEIQDTLKNYGATGPIKPMKKAVNISVSIMTFFYILIAVTGYVAFGNQASYNILEQYTTGPKWAVIIAQSLVLVHMIPAYQVWSQPFFQFVDLHVERSKTFPRVLGGGRPWLFRLWFRTLYTIVVTFFACLLPFFGIILGFVGAVGFWPATVFFPIECWIAVFQPRRVYKYWLRALNILCFFITLLAVVGSVALIIQTSSTFTIFST